MNLTSAFSIRFATLVALAASTVLLVSAPCSFGADSLVVKVHIQDAAGQPMTGVTVRLVPSKPDGSPDKAFTVLTLKSDKKGRAVFAFIKPGRFVLTAESDGLVATNASLKMRTGENKIAVTTDGTRIEDASFAIPAAKPEVTLQIPNIVFSVEVNLTMGQPVQAQAVEAPSTPVISPTQADLKLAGEQIQAGQFAEGLASVDRALAADPTLLESDESAALAINYLKGYALTNLDRSAEAEPFLREAMRLSPELPGGSRLLARALLAQQKFAEAVEWLNLALIAAGDDAPQRSRVLFLLGQAYEELGKPAEAVTALEEAHQLTPNDQDLLVQLINALTIADRNDEAEALISSADLPAKEGAVLHFNLAVGLIPPKKFVDAERHLLKALELSPGMAEAYRLLGEVSLGLNKRTEAIKAFEAYLAASPTASDASDIRKVIDAVKGRK